MQLILLDKEVDKPLSNKKLDEINPHSVRYFKINGHVYDKVFDITYGGYHERLIQQSLLKSTKGRYVIYFIKQPDEYHKEFDPFGTLLVGRYLFSSVTHSTIKRRPDLRRYALYYSTDDFAEILHLKLLLS